MPVSFASSSFFNGASLLSSLELLLQHYIKASLLFLSLLTSPYLSFFFLTNLVAFCYDLLIYNGLSHSRLKKQQKCHTKGIIPFVWHLKSECTAEINIIRFLLNQFFLLYLCKCFCPFNLSI